MFDTINHNCAFAEEVVAYLYGELENNCAFETHLQSCASCADELKSFGAVRAGVADWRALEFDSLATPTIKIEYAPTIQPTTAVAPTAQNESWLDGLRKIFAFSPAFAAVAALVFVAVCAGLIAYNSGGKNQIAGLENKSNSAQSNGAATAKVESEIPASDGADVGGGNEIAAKVSPEPTADGDKVKPAQDARKIAAPQRIAKISNVAVKRPTVGRKVYNLPFNQASFNSNSAVALNDSTVKTRRAPKLSSIEDEDEEATLRLSDLLDDAGGK